MIYLQLPAISNKADWVEKFTITNSSDGSPVDVTGTAFKLVLRDANDSITLTASTATGEITQTATNEIQIYVPVARVSGLVAGDYDIGMISTITTFTDQVFTGKINVIDGVVS